MPALSLSALTDLLARVLTAQGMSGPNARAIAHVIALAECSGTASHGVMRLDGYLASLRSGAVDGRAVPQVEDAAPGVVRVDAMNGYAQPAIAAGRELAKAKARAAGVAVLAVRNSHHLAALWPDVEPFAAEGFIALAFVNSRPRIAPWDAPRKLLGTNPMAFACPRADGPPLVFDQASSVMAQGEVLIAARERRTLPPGVLIDSAGRETRDPAEVTRGGALRTFGGHKGSSIALMVEIMAACIGGGRFGFEDAVSEAAGAATQSANQTIVLLSPEGMGVPDLPQRVATLLVYLRDGGVSRLPSAARQRRAADDAHLTDAAVAQLEALAFGQGG